jgi:hypothetical protein
MTEMATDTSSSTSIWGTIVSVAMLILAIKFPILFLINGLFSLGIGIFFGLFVELFFGLFVVNNLLYIKLFNYLVNSILYILICFK